MAQQWPEKENPKLQKARLLNINTSKENNTGTKIK